MAIPKAKKTAAKKTSAKKTAVKKTVKSKKTAPPKPVAIEAKLEQATDIPEHEMVIEQEAAAQAAEPADAAEPEFTPAPRPPAKLERLQKILARAGVASRRSAETMIEQGRVEVNGQVVTVLGTKADAARDHIRVDSKLLQGPERHRYFVLNKPRGFVTTVKDPEGRPTVMQFFDKMKERLYPVGRLDYMSEGLLVVTNDGELANRLTKASSGVEKTYLVKVAGQPTEAELDILRGGVAIERGKPGSGQVRTGPARIRQVRQGDNPWYEVVLTEGRNREIRKMFEEVGHFVEKIRRVGYGPLVLDQEPGGLRELQPEELAALRRAAEGSLRTPKSKELRRRNLMDAGHLPTVLPKPSNQPRPNKPMEWFASTSGRPGNYRAEKFDSGRPGEFRPKKFGADRDRTNRTSRPAESFASGAANKLFRPSRPAGAFDQSTGKSLRPAWKKDDRAARPPTRFAAGSSGENRPGAGRPFTAKPVWKKPERPAPDRSGPGRFAARPAWKKDNRAARPSYQRPSAPRREAPAREARVFDEDLGPVRPPNLHIEEITGSARPFTTSSGKPRAGGARPSSKPFKAGFSKPRAPADRSSSVGWKPGKPAFSSSRPFTPRTEGASSYRPNKAKPYPNSTSRAERKAGAGWKPKPNFGPGKPAGGVRSKAKPGDFSKSGAPTDRSSSVRWKSGYKGKRGGANRSGPRPFGNRPGGKRTGGFSSGKKRS
jgi:23S rRNA pseudouridine2605 synthase